MDQTLDQPKIMQIDLPSYEEAWAVVTSQLRAEMTRGMYESWVEPLVPLGFKEGVFRVAAVNVYGREWVETRLGTRITRLLESLFHQPVTLHFTVPGARPQAAAKAIESRAAVEVEPPAQTSPSPSKNKKAQPSGSSGEPSQRKIQLQRAYGSERASVVQPERGMFLTTYFFNNWLPLLGHSAFTIILAARSMCYWNPFTDELRNVVETDMSELARRASVSVRTVKDVLNNDLVRRYFLRYKVRRVMTPNGVRTAGIVLQVRMDDPLTPEDQSERSLPEDERWYTADFEDETEA